MVDFTPQLTAGLSYRAGAGTTPQGKKHKHKQICGIFPDWVGAKKLFMCFFGVIPYGAEKNT